MFRTASAVVPARASEGPGIALEEQVLIRLCDGPGVSVLSVRHLSVTGFAIHTNRPVVPGVPARVHFACGDDFALVLFAVPIHCHQVDRHSHFSGWEFISDSTYDAAIDVLLATVQAPCEVLA
jgi:hypothetical protein